LVHDLIIFKTV